jgi:hypothetical protein
MIAGDANVVSGALHTFIGYVSACIVNGEDIDVFAPGSAYASFMGGQDHELNARFDYGVLCGETNFINANTISCIVNGRVHNFAGQTRDSTISGESNQVNTNCNRSSLNGFNNTVGTFTNSDINGADNTVTLSNASYTGGNTNNINISVLSIVHGGGISIPIRVGQSIVIGEGHNGRIEESAVFGDSNTVTHVIATLVSGWVNVVTPITFGSFISGISNQHSASQGANTMGESLINQRDHQTVIGRNNIAQGTNLSTDHQFIIGNGPDSATRRNSYAIRFDNIHQWYPAVPAQANNAAAIVALTGLGAANLFVGALAMVVVAGVPNWFAWNGAAWIFKY